MKPDHVLFFVKFFEQETYAQEFIRGNLYLQPLSAFLEMEDKNDGRADRHDSPLLYYPRSQLSYIQIANHRIGASDLLDDIVIHPVAAKPLNIFCVYAATPGRFADEGIADDGEYLAHLKLPEQCLSMGRYAVVVSPPPVFSQRFRAAVKRDGFLSAGRLVNYFDSAKVSGPFKEPVFNKKKQFAWQREFRFVVNRRLVTGEPYRLDIGDISDLCIMTETAKFNDEFKIVFHD
jgi:hypothetical protein